MVGARPCRARASLPAPERPPRLSLSTRSRSTTRVYIPGPTYRPTPLRGPLLFVPAAFRAKRVFCEYLEEGREHQCESIDVDVEECCEIEEQEEGEANCTCCSRCEDFTDGRGGDRARPDSDFEGTKADEREQGGLLLGCI